MFANIIATVHMTSYARQLIMALHVTCPVIYRLWLQIIFNNLG